jgi:hypothetical protein
MRNAVSNDAEFSQLDPGTESPEKPPEVVEAAGLGFRDVLGRPPMVMQILIASRCLVFPESEF